MAVADSQLSDQRIEHEQSAIDVPKNNPSEASPPCCARADEARLRRKNTDGARAIQIDATGSRLVIKSIKLANKKLINRRRWLLTKTKG